MRRLPSTAVSSALRISTHLRNGFSSIKLLSYDAAGRALRP
jgi:hypothetical protein